MAEQYAVVYYPDQTINVRVVGPFRSYGRALIVGRRLTKELDSHQVSEFAPPRTPHIVTMLTDNEAIELDRIEEPEGSES